MKVLTIKQSREFDKKAINDYGIPGITLMNEAGRAVADEIINRYFPKKTLIVCGKGNNAGDGYVIAQALLNSGFDCYVHSVLPGENLTGDAHLAWKQYRNYPTLLPLDRITIKEEAFDLIVDALLGTGITGAVKNEFADVINAINYSGIPIVSVDVPSGLRDLIPGENIGTVVKANLTVTIGLPKKNLLEMPGLEFVGEITTVPINFPDELLNCKEYQLHYYPDDELRNFIPPRPRDSHKGMFGNVGVLAGSPQYTGAAILAAKAALKSGCGLCTVYAPAGLNPIYKIAIPEAITRISPESPTGGFAAKEISLLVKDLDRHSALAVGPGLGQGNDIDRILENVFKQCDVPMVIDADAINYLSDKTDLIQGKKHWVLTPHPKEMSRLTGLSVIDIQNNRVAVAQAFALKFQTNILLKGSSTIVAAHDGNCTIIPGGTSALAKGGTGDVLTGIIATFLSQGLSPWKAAVLGATCHLRAGMECEDIYTEYGTIATDVCNRLPYCIKKISL